MSPRLRTLSALLSPARPSASGDHACAAAAFSTTAAASYAAAREPNYYEILNVPVTASAAEIKKQFYALSLTHHPDRNRSDPTATSRFASISSAYHVLSDSTKRARYDHDHGFHRVAAAQNPYTSTHSSASPGQHPMGSYSSYGANLHNKGSYVGSRPASGLSKRRGPFRGPPPSFYAHGGYGANAARNNNSAGMSGQTSSSSSASASMGSSGGSGSKGSSSPTHEDPTSFIDRNPVYHFNARSHFRTQAAEDARRQQRRSREMGIDLDDANLARGGSMVLRFMVVCGILAGAGATAGLSGRGPTTSGSRGSSRSR
ncbi:hypothetical protein VTN00DRAFT_1392 [Thermoascus crustaceus]|uniref:uncharacterized protein n=1 Tax=Thermoascus crustaceus TaxID=5088 RepID=UPI0037436D65